MPSSDVEKQRLYRRRWYERNKIKQRAYKARRQRELRAWIRGQKQSCELCLEEHPGCLVFHHRDPDEKDFTIGEAIRSGWSKQRIIAEIAKCQVLCANCHSKLHWDLVH